MNKPGRSGSDRLPGLFIDRVGFFFTGLLLLFSHCRNEL